jgi:hypothetical protein
MVLSPRLRYRCFFFSLAFGSGIVFLLLLFMMKERNPRFQVDLEEYDQK